MGAHGSRPDRRDVLTVGAVGITSLVLPSAAAAASGEIPPIGEQGSSLSAPTGVTAVPIGYVSDDARGAIRVTWDAVNGATSYRVGWATVSSGNGPYTYEAAGTATSFDLVGRVGTDTTHHVVVEASDGSSTFTSAELTSSSVVATGGDITTFVGNGTIGAAGTTYVVHSFTTGGTFKLNRSIDVEHLVVGGGGGGGGCTGRSFCAGGGGGGGVVTGSVTRTAGEYVVEVGAGGRGGPDATLSESPGAEGYARGGGSSEFGEVIALGGGAGGSAPFGGGSATSDPFALPTPKATGGGGAGQSSSQAGAGVSPRKGGNGTSSTDAGSQRAGGGGGAGGDGGVGSGDTSGSGGVGVASSISGTSVEYGSGGGGGKRASGFGGPGGALAGLATAGGSGGRDAAGSDGVEGRGGGGGGSGRGTTPDAGVAVGGDGGSGVVIVRVALPS